MSRVLQQAPVSGEVRAIGHPDGALVVGDLRILLDDAVAAATERGRQEGLAAARADALAAADRIGACIRDAVEDGLHRLREQRKEEAAEVVAMALEIAGVVLGREPAADAGLLAGRIRAALEELEDVSLRAFVNPADRDLVAPALADLADVEVLADPAIAAGESRIKGRWSDAALTRASALEAVRRALQGDD